MTKGRNTTYEERIALVKECIENGYNYGEIAKKYKVGYNEKILLTGEKLPYLTYAA